MQIQLKGINSISLRKFDAANWFLISLAWGSAWLSNAQQGDFFVAVILEFENFEPVLHLSLLPLLLHCLKDKTLAADWHVQVFAPNQLDIIINTSAQREWSLVVTDFANRVQLLNLLAFGHQIKNVVEWLSERCASKNWHNHNFAAQSSILSKRNDVFKELSLVNANHIEVAPDFLELWKLINGNGFLLF